MAEEAYVWITREIPHDKILLHILPKLPAKTIARFRSVCKRCNSFLKTPVFENLHHHHATNNHHQYNHKLLVSSTEKPFRFFSVDCEAPEEVLSITPPFKVGRDHYVSILTSCNGMICLGIMKKWSDACYADLILWNPVSSEYKVLSKTNYHTENHRDKYDNFEMYYDSSEDDYKILRLTRCGNSCYVYSLKSDLWREIVTSVTPQSSGDYFSWTQSVVLDEKIYYLKKELYGDVCIIRFDTKIEKFTKIATLSCTRSDDQTILVEKGSFHLCVMRDHYIDTKKRIEVFRMNGDGDWTSMKTYSPKWDLDAHMRPLHFMRNGNWLMHYNGYLYDVDMEKLNSSDDFDPLYNELLFITGNGKYIETFVSPNRYM